MLMRDDWGHIEPVMQLRTINRVLDRIAPEFPGEVIEEAVQIMLRAVAQGEMARAVIVLEEVVQANPFWLRGYLLLATLYQQGHQIEQAMTTVEKGLTMCARSLRLFRAHRWVATVKRITGHVVQGRISNDSERFRRYDGIFRHRLAMLQIQSGCFDEALQHWPITEEEHCAC